MEEKNKNRKKIIGTRVRVGDAPFPDDKDTHVLGQDITVIAPKDSDADVIGLQVKVQIGSPFGKVYNAIDSGLLLPIQKEQLKSVIREFEQETNTRKDEGKSKGILTWLQNNANWLVPTVVEVLSKLK